MRDHHAAHPAGSSAARIGTWLGALVPRVMYPGGWTHAARFAGAEPLLTGRTRIYDESTLRQAANQLDAEGCSARVAPGPVTARSPGLRTSTAPTYCATVPGATAR